MTVLSVASVLSEAARRSPDRVAVVEPGPRGTQRLTFSDLWTDARRYAAALEGQGLQPGSRIALLCPNVSDFVRGYYGILAMGGVVVPIPTLLTARESAQLLESSDASVLIVHPSCAEAGRAAAEQAGRPALDLSTFADGVRPIDLLVSRAAEDEAVIFYTSGTTGRPKGARLTHLNLVLGATIAAFDSRRFSEDDVVLGCLPLFHVYGQLVALNATFRAGASLVLQPRFDAAAALDLMVEEGVTRFFGVPTMYIHLLEEVRRRGPACALPGLRDCVSGGAPLPVSVLEGFEHRFSTTILEGYGLSETTGSGTVNQERFGVRPGTVGHPIWGVEVEVADPARLHEIAVLPAGARGEVVVRGHNVFAGYLDDPDATAEVMVDGWFRTGDIGVKDADGFVSIVDRQKDLIIRGGFNVYPREVEEALLAHPDVGSVAVIGVPDAVSGEEVCAVVVPAAGRTVDPEELVAWSGDRLGRHKFPRRVEVVDELPLGPSHKVLKRELRTRFSTTESA